jgi:hypothetical protein
MRLCLSAAGSRAPKRSANNPRLSAPIRGKFFDFGLSVLISVIRVYQR